MAQDFNPGTVIGNVFQNPASGCGYGYGSSCLPPGYGGGYPPSYGGNPPQNPHGNVRTHRSAHAKHHIRPHDADAQG